MKNTCPFYIVFQVLKVLLIKICKKQPLNLLFFLLLLLAFTTSADIIFHKLLELHSTLFEKKKIFVTNFPFLMVHLIPYPLNGQIPLSMTKFFADAPLYQTFPCIPLRTMVKQPK